MYNVVVNIMTIGMSVVMLTVGITVVAVVTYRWCRKYL